MLLFREHKTDFVFPFKREKKAQKATSNNWNANVQLVRFHWTSYKLLCSYSRIGLSISRKNDAAIRYSFRISKDVIHTRIVRPICDRPATMFGWNTIHNIANGLLDQVKMPQINIMLAHTPLCCWIITKCRKSLSRSEIYLSNSKTCHSFKTTAYCTYSHRDSWKWLHFLCAFADIVSKRVENNKAPSEIWWGKCST